MSERFIKFIPSEAAIQFAIKYKNAFVLLMIIAERARRENGHPDGLTIGQCHLGSHKNYGMTDKEYRYSKKILVEHGLIKIILTSRTRKKAEQTKKLFESTFGANEGANEPTTTGTLVELCNSTVWDINSDDCNHQKGERRGEPGANEGRMKGDKQERRRKKKKEKEDHPSIPSKKSEPEKRADGMSDDFSFENGKQEIQPGIFLSAQDLEACVKIKGSVEKVREAIAFIQASKRRKHDISDWPNALASWKIETKVKARVEDNVAFAEELCKRFECFSHGCGWQCYLHTDRNKDQRGIVFQPESPYKQAIFIPLVDGQFKEKCHNTIKINNMEKKHALV
jgi:hypothetical protein